MGISPTVLSYTSPLICLDIWTKFKSRDKPTVKKHLIKQSPQIHASIRGSTRWSGTTKTFLPKSTLKYNKITKLQPTHRWSTVRTRYLAALYKRVLPRFEKPLISLSSNPPSNSSLLFAMASEVFIDITPSFCF